MLTTRLWMGALMVLLTAGMLIADQWLPLYPFLFIFVLSLSLAAVKELIALLGPQRRVHALILYVGVLAMVTANWLTGHEAEPWALLLFLVTAILLGSFMWEMAVFRAGSAEDGPMERMGRTLWALGYLGVLPCFLVQLRWLHLPNQAGAGSIALALVIFVPKSGDIGAYCTGRLLGRHPMTPVLSPKKTWEGAAGGLALAVLVAIGIDRLAPVSLLGNSLIQEIAFGLTLGIAGMLGDLAESLIKRACRRKDASTTVPGFGGVLDVIDSVLFAAPVGYFWLKVVPHQ